MAFVSSEKSRWNEVSRLVIENILPIYIFENPIILIYYNCPQWYFLTILKLRAKNPKINYFIYLVYDNFVSFAHADAVGASKRNIVLVRRLKSNLIFNFNLIIAPARLYFRNYWKKRSTKHLHPLQWIMIDKK